MEQRHSKDAMDYVRANRELLYKEFGRKFKVGDPLSPVEKACLKAIQAAITAGLDDEALGKFVRTMFST